MSTYRHPACIVLGIATILATLAGPAAAQQMGREPYQPGAARNPSIAAQLELQRQLRNQSAAGLSALQQYVTTYNSSSTAVGNINSVTQNVGDGASASVGQSTQQDSDGDQGSSASTDVEQTSSVNTSEALIEALTGDAPAGGGQAQ